MSDVLVNESEATKMVVRRYEGLVTNDTNKVLIVLYREIVLIDGVELTNVVKEYKRDYKFWKESPIGEAILGMINEDLAQDDPDAPRD